MEILRLEEAAGHRMAEGFKVDWTEAASGKEVLINLEELAHKFGKTADARKPGKWLFYEGTKGAFESVANTQEAIQIGGDAGFEYKHRSRGLLFARSRLNLVTYALASSAPTPERTKPEHT